MSFGKYTISCLLGSTQGYYDGRGWNRDIHETCLYTPMQAQMKLQEIAQTAPDASVRCMIQDKAFNYYDGKTFSERLAQAKLFTLEEAEAQVRVLMSRVL